MGIPAESEKVLAHEESPKMQIDDPNIEQEKSRLTEAIAQIIDNDLPTKEKTQQISQIIKVSRESFSGPIPHPRIVGGYKEFIPDAPERILTMAEKEQQHRIDVENEMLTQNKMNITNSKNANLISQIFAFILILVLICTGAMLTLYGHQAVGITIFGTTILGVAGVFVTGKLSQRNSDNKK